jgi:L-ascorbate metabolism protein UlaG (beta-lactamase superfamily)
LLAVIVGIGTHSGISVMAASSREARRSIEIAYLGNTGWQITDGTTVILVDPFLSELRKDRTDDQQITPDDLIAARDPVSIDAHMHNADYILITHSHYDHMIDAPSIAKKAGAVIIRTESAASIARAYRVGEQFTPDKIDGGKRHKGQQLIVVRGGESFRSLMRCVPFHVRQT